MLKTIIVGMALFLTVIADGKNLPQHKLTVNDYHQIECLAHNIYFEAGNQSRKGRIAVGLVTFNRVNSGYFPDTICDVVKQTRYRVCQFSWWCNQKTRAQSIAKKFVGVEQKVYSEIYKLATSMYLNHKAYVDVTKGAVFYHATYISPRWKGLKKTVLIEKHVFYRKI